jgi:hypothetical protein
VADGTWNTLGWFVAAVGMTQAAALLFWATLGARPKVRGVALVVLVAAVLAAPLVVPAEARVQRGLAAVAAVTAALHMWDAHLGAGRGVRPGFLEFLALLPNVFGLVHRRLRDAPRPTMRQEVRRIAWCVTGATPAMVAFVVAFAVDWTRWGFALEHSVKVLLLFLVIVPLVGALGSGWRLLGGRGLDFMDNPFAARTPADFWRRYNRPVHQALHEDVFVPAGGRRRPMFGALLVFVVSAAVHEYVFAVPVGRVQGYQTAFFLVQGVAVAGTMRLRPRGWAAAGGVAVTLAFNVATGVLFFASMNGVVPFYDNAGPLGAAAACGGPASRRLGEDAVPTGVCVEAES